jgi:hypothetical protein
MKILMFLQHLLTLLAFAALLVLQIVLFRTQSIEIALAALFILTTATLAGSLYLRRPSNISIARRFLSTRFGYARQTARRLHRFGLSPSEMKKQLNQHMIEYDRQRAIRNIREIVSSHTTKQT